MERGSPLYVANGSLDYAESGFLRIPSRFCLGVFEFVFEFANTVVLVTYSGRSIQYTFCLASHQGLTPTHLLARTCSNASDGAICCGMFLSLNLFFCLT